MDGHDEPLLNNFRPPQPINGRTVYYANLNFKPDDCYQWKKDDYCNIETRYVLK